MRRGVSSGALLPGRWLRPPFEGSILRVGAMLRAAWEGTAAGGVSAHAAHRPLDKPLLDRASIREVFAALRPVLVSPERHTARNHRGWAHAAPDAAARYAVG